MVREVFERFNHQYIIHCVDRNLHIFAHVLLGYLNTVTIDISHSRNTAPFNVYDVYPWLHVDLGE